MELGNVTLKEILKGNLPRLKTREEELEEFEAKNPYKPKFPLVEKATYIGIECEIEGITPETLVRTPVYWTMIPDGSLRNNGREFITLPIKVSRAEQALVELFSKGLRPGYSYSERTSTHVHMNVRTLTINQLKSLILTYMVFEKALFNWVGNNREKNIFCVPLYDVILTKDLLTAITNPHNLLWLKYTALNLKPIMEKGTIEFRHLHGTNDVKLIMTWINFMLSLKRYALRNSPETVVERITTLNTKSDYYIFGKEVFGDMVENLIYPKFEKDISFCTSNIKAQCFAQKPAKRTYNKLTAKFKIARQTAKPPQWYTGADEEAIGRILGRTMPLPPRGLVNTVIDDTPNHLVPMGFAQHFTLNIEGNN